MFHYRTREHSLLHAAMRIYQRLDEIIDTLPDDGENVGAELNTARTQWWNLYTLELAKEATERQQRLLDGGSNV